MISWIYLYFSQSCARFLNYLNYFPLFPTFQASLLTSALNVVFNTALCHDKSMSLLVITLSTFHCHYSGVVYTHAPSKFSFKTVQVVSINPLWTIQKVWIQISNKCGVRGRIFFLLFTPFFNSFSKVHSAIIYQSVDWMILFFNWYRFPFHLLMVQFKSN